MAYRLVVADVVEYDVRFSLRDGARAHPFGMRLQADRATPEQMAAETSEGASIGDFLRSRHLRMTAWLGDSPFVDEAGAPVPAGEGALQAALDQIPGVASLVYMGFLEANGAKGKQGN